MAIRVRKTKTGKKRYDAIYYDSSSKQRWRTFKKHRLAQTFLCQVNVKKVQGELGLAVENRMYFNKYANIWLERHSKIKKTPKSYRNDRSRINNFGEIFS